MRNKNARVLKSPMHAQVPSWMLLAPNRDWGLWDSNNLLTAEVTR